MMQWTEGNAVRLLTGGAEYFPALIDAIDGSLAALDRKIADLDTEESASKKELSEIGSRIAGSRGRTLMRGRSFYKMTRAGLLPVGGGFEGWISHAMRVERRYWSK